MSLIEMMVVIANFVILMALLFPVFAGAIKKVTEGGDADLEKE